MNNYLKLYLIMMAIEIPLAFIMDLFNPWGLSISLLIFAWISVIGLNTLSYWASVYILERGEK